MRKLKQFDPLKERGIKMAPTPVEARGVKSLRATARPSGRDADPRRTIPLNSSRWQRLRAAVLAREPLCRDCKHVATDVDHDDGDPSNNSAQNLVPRCHSCHSSKTMRERHGTVIGCDASGIPNDPNHPWNREREAKKSPEPDAARPPPNPRLYRNGRT